MKTILLIFIISFSLKADTEYKGRCVSSFFYNYSTSLLNINYSDGTFVNFTPDTTSIDSLTNNLNKFEYISNVTPKQCRPIARNNTLGMTNEQYTFMMALTGLLTSILLVFIIFLKV